MAFYLNARQTKFLGTLLVLAFITFVWFFSQPPTRSTENPSLPDGNSLSTPEAPVRSDALASTSPAPATDASSIFLKDFQRKETRAGKLLWEAQGENARYSPKEEQIEIEKGYLQFTSESNGLIEIRADRSLLHLDASALRSAKLEGNVVVIFDKKTTLKTAEARYLASEHRIRAAGEVEIFHPFVYTRGIGLEADTESRSVLLMRRVESVLSPKAKEELSDEKK